MRPSSSCYSPGRPPIMQAFYLAKGASPGQEDSKL